MVLLDRSEFMLCAEITGGADIPYFGDAADVDEAAAESAVERLSSRGVIRHKDDELVLSRETMLCFGAAADPDARLCLSDDGTKKLRAFFIHGETIAMMDTDDGETVRVSWLPFLPLAVGGCANYLGSFDGADADREYNTDEASAKELEKTLDAPDRTISIEGISHDGEPLSMLALVRGGEHIVRRDSESGTKLVRMSKATFVNAITAWLAPALGSAMRKRGVING